MITLNNLPFNVRKYFPTSSSQPQVPKNFAFLFQWSGAHSTLLKELRNGIFLSISVNSGYHNHQGLQPSNMSQWASETQGWKEYLSSDYRHSLKWALSILRMWKHSILTSESCWCILKGWFSVSPDSCIFPYIVK